MKKLIFFILALVVTGFVACNYYISHQFRAVYKDANAFLHTGAMQATFLKAHMKNGDVYVLDDKWKLMNDSLLTGKGTHYDFNRNELEKNVFNIPVRDIAILETNRPIENRDAGRITGLVIVTVVDVIIAVVCITNPKACFGSCPTFYYQNDANIHYANAEGFSSAIAPSLEEGDIDALNNATVTDGDFTLTMKNEALETHAVNQVKLLAVPRKENQRIYNDRNGNFYACQNIFQVSAASADEGDITKKINRMDDAEWYSLADSTDLHTKETIHLDFVNGQHQSGVGLLINFRQTLLTTFLLYSAYGYMGDEVGDLFAKVETDDDLRQQLKNTCNTLGGIEVAAFNERSGSWQIIDTLSETGPIAKNLQLVSLSDEFKNQNNIRIQLKLTKGLWRIDYAAMTTVLGSIIPDEILPYEVTKNGVSDHDAMENISNDDKKYESSLPGDTYKLNFKLPDAGHDYELFVYSKGYYLEWIRGEWLKEKNIKKLKGMIDGDPATWQSLAKEFKSAEGTMESTFWSSKVSQ